MAEKCDKSEINSSVRTNADPLDTSSMTVSDPVDEQHHATHLDAPYLKTLRQVLNYGEPEMDRTGTGTLSIFGTSVRYDLRSNFPLFTHKQLPYRWIFEEMLWMLDGYTDAAVLEARGIDIWKEWSAPGVLNRELGPIYGEGFRSFTVGDGGGYCGACNNQDMANCTCESAPANKVDQLRDLLINLQRHPAGRRHLITLWNPHTVNQCALPPCHGIAIHFKRTVSRRGTERLHCCMLQRSCDMFLGVPFNVASYAFLTYLIADFLGIQPGYLQHHMDDTHIYKNHIGQVRQVLNRELVESPRLKINIQKFITGDTPEKRADSFLDLISAWPGEAYTLWGLAHGDDLTKRRPERPIIQLLDYQPHPKVEAPVRLKLAKARIRLESIEEDHDNDTTE